EEHQQRRPHRQRGRGPAADRSTVGARRREGRRRQGPLRRRECVQGPGRLCGRRTCLRREERVQRAGVDRLERGRLQGQGWKRGRRDGGEEVGTPTGGRADGPAPRTFPGMSSMLPFLGHGIGLRPVHYPDLLDGAPGAEWYEVISENYMIRGGRPLHVLERVREVAPIMLHGVSLSLGSTDPLNETYLAELRELAQRFEPAGVSDHLCWGSIGGRYAHDLLPLPYTEEALAHVADRIRRVQDALGRRILVENVSSYLTFHHSVLPEWKFLAAVAERADCGILFDVNNVYVSARNHGFSAHTYLDAIPADRVGQIHLAGHSDHG